MGWYSTPFNYDGTSPTQVRDDLQKANENFQTLSEVFENGTPLSGKIKSSYLPGGGSVSGDITVNSVTISNLNEVNFGIDLSSNPSGFYQAAIKMPVGVSGSAIQWQPTSGGWGAGESKIGVDTSGNFRIIGRYNSSGRRSMILSDDVYVDGNLIVNGTISGSISLPSTPTFQHVDIKTTSSDTYGLNFRNGVNNFTNSACIIMPSPGTAGNQILWGTDPNGDSRIGLSTGGVFYIIGSGSGSSRQVNLYDNVVVSGNLTVGGTVTQGSDLSIKENIELFSDSALNLIKNIDVYKYLFKVDQREHVGFIANYVKDVFPMGVTVSEEDGKCSINILDMLALLFKAVKELAEHVANN